MRFRICILALIVVFSSGLSRAQVAGVTRTGESTERDASFLDHFGQEVDYPRLNSNGHILYYSPIVVLDSVRVASASTVAFYGNVLFDGWSPVLSRGFEYAERADFSSSLQVSSTGTMGIFAVGVSELSYNRDYFVRPFAVNAYGTSYGRTATFHTGVGPVNLDTMWTRDVSPYGADIEVGITENGGSPLSGELVAFSDEEYRNPVASQVLSGISGPTALANLSGLEPSTDYYVQAVLTNGLFSDTMRLRFRTPTDLNLTIVSSGNPTVNLCEGGKAIVYTAQLSGTDVNRPFYHYRWHSSVGTSGGDTTDFLVLFDSVGVHTVEVEAYYGVDRLSATYAQTISPRAGSSSFYVCTNEFLNTAEATTTNIASIRWLNNNQDIVAVSKSVKLPTGFYTVECTDNYGCELSKEVYVGKKKYSCVATDSVWSNERAHFENGEWRVDSVSDQDGNWYAVTQIGNQCWTRQNLRTRHSPSTNVDLVTQHSAGNRSMRYTSYKNSANTYDPQTVAYYAAVYSWSGAMDRDDVSTYHIFDFDRPIRGICPRGWHLPQYEETWEMVEAVYNMCCADEEPYPPLGIFQLYGGLNAPLPTMLLECCYASITNPSYPEELYDASHLSLLRSPQSSYGGQFWIANCPDSAGAGYIFLHSSQQQGVAVWVDSRASSYNYVRCVRGNVEE